MLRTIIFSGILLLAAVSAQAQSAWQNRADVLAAGAAASIIAFHICEGDSRPAGEKAHHRLEGLAQSLAAGAGAGLRDVQLYLVESTNQKVRAMWQANQGVSCSRTSRLRQLAESTGFEVPAESR